MTTTATTKRATRDEIRRMSPEQAAATIATLRAKARADEKTSKRRGLDPEAAAFYADSAEAYRRSARRIELVRGQGFVGDGPRV